MHSRLAYPYTRRDPIVDLFHDTPVADPYRWLENADSAESICWTEEQNALTRGYLDGALRDELRLRLRELYDYPRASAPQARGGRYFFTRNQGLQNQPILYVQAGLEATPRPLLDPNTLRDDGTIALTAFEASPDGRYVAYALSGGGSDRQDLHVVDAVQGIALGDHLRWAKFVTMAWNRESSGFYYTRFPEPGRVPPGEENYRPSVFFHRLGDPQDADRLVAGPPEDPEIVLDVHASTDRRFLVVTAYKGASEQSAVTVYDLASDQAPVRFQTSGFEHKWTFVDAIEDVLYFRTDLHAPRARIVAVAPDGSIREVVAERADSLVEAHAVAGLLAAKYLRNASSQVVLFRADGEQVADIPLPAIGSVTEMSTDEDTGALFLRFASFTWPPAVYRYAVAEGTLHTFLAPAAHISPEAYVVRQEWYTSSDGTRVPMFLVHARERQDMGTRPVWLTAYGGFNVSIVPDFDPAHFVFLERGGLLAVPNLRGGGEFGEEWHAAGTRERKQNVFDDFIAAAEWLIVAGHTRAGQIVMEGGSNGGLLVSAVLVQRPDLPGAVICRVPVADMLRYHRFTVGRFWIPEYGCADDPADFSFLIRYSPLHNVRDGVAYPAVLITTAETDDRVDPGMARKLAARLQSATAGEAPILIRIEQRAGHGAGKPVAKLIEEDADIYAFALRALQADCRD